MIETKILGDAPGIQNQGLIDKTESTSLPAMTNGVIVGRFKRGRMDKTMVVNANNYQAVLGHDPNNPSYIALEDVFALGVNKIFVLRTGSSAQIPAAEPAEKMASYINMVNANNTGGW